MQENLRREKPTATRFEEYDLIILFNIPNLYMSECINLCKEYKILKSQLEKGLIRSKCKEGKPIGFFHVYRPDEPAIRHQDVRIGYQYGLICGSDRGKLLYFERKDFDTDTNKQMLSLISSSSKLKQKLDRIRSTYFDKINIYERQIE